MKESRREPRDLPQAIKDDMTKPQKEAMAKSQRLLKKLLEE